MHAQQAQAKLFILTQPQFEAPAVQQKFSLSYTDITEVLDELIAEKKIEFDSGITFKVKTSVAVDLVSKYIEKYGDKQYLFRSEDERSGIRALWVCMHNGEASAACIQRNMPYGYFKASRALEWMEKNGFVSPYPDRRIIITKDEFVKLFGNFDGDIDDDEKRSSRFGKYSDSLRNSILDRLRSDLDDEGEDEDEEEDDDSDEDGIEDISFPEPRKIICSDDGIVDISAVNVAAALAESVQCSVHEEGNEKFVLGLDGLPDFSFKFVRNGSSLRISDGGQTLASSKLSRRQIQNRIKQYELPIELSEDEISITIANPTGTLKALLVLYALIDSVTKGK